MYAVDAASFRGLRLLDGVDSLHQLLLDLAARPAAGVLFRRTEGRLLEVGGPRAGGVEPSVLLIYGKVSRSSRSSV